VTVPKLTQGAIAPESTAAKIGLMRRKKLLTVGCAAGILACGACFAPPPRIRVNLHGSRRIRVRVNNTSDTRRVDPAVLGPCIADAVNGNIRGKATATAGGEAQPGDIVLEVTVMDEQWDEHPVYAIRSVDWYRLNLSASLNRSDGTVFWSKLNRNNRGAVDRAPSSILSDSARLTAGLRYSVCEPLAIEMLYGAR
jgi:hypothetical protein